MDDDLEAVEEALRHASEVPEEQRGLAWQRYVDSLLDKRVKLTADQHAVVFSGQPS